MNVVEDLVKRQAQEARDNRKSNRAESSAHLAVSTDNVTTPTDAELDTAFGTPATVGSGFTALVDDNGAGSAVFLVASDGSNWWYVAMTKAA